MVAVVYGDGTPYYFDRAVNQSMMSGRPGEVRKAERSANEVETSALKILGMWKGRYPHCLQTQYRKEISQANLNLYYILCTQFACTFKNIVLQYKYVILFENKFGRTEKFFSEIIISDYITNSAGSP